MPALFIPFPLFKRFSDSLIFDKVIPSKRLQLSLFQVFYFDNILLRFNKKIKLNFEFSWPEINTGKSKYKSDVNQV